MQRATRVSLDGERVVINGEPTYKGTEAEGLLYNVRPVTATFDDTWGTVDWWDADGTHPENDKACYGAWRSPRSAAENTRRFVEALPEYHSRGIRAVNLTCQGGHPLSEKSWIPEGKGSAGARGNGHRDFYHKSAFGPDGSIDPNYARRVGQVIEACDRLGMVVILQFFYFGQDTVFGSEDAIRAAVDNGVDFVCKRGYTNVLGPRRAWHSPSGRHIRGLSQHHAPERLARARHRQGLRFVRCDLLPRRGQHGDRSAW